jgi:hypothetical protein
MVDATGPASETGTSATVQRQRYHTIDPERHDFGEL